MPRASILLFLILFLIQFAFADYTIWVNSSAPALVWSAGFSPYNETGCGMPMLVSEGIRQGVSVLLNFTGIAIFLDALSFESSGALSVVLDGMALVVQTARPAPSTGCNFATVFSQAGLENKPHSINVTLTTQDSYFDYVAFRYIVKDSTPQPSPPTDTGNPSPSLNPPLLIAAIVIGSVSLVGLIALGIVVTRRRSQTNLDLAQAPMAQTQTQTQPNPVALGQPLMPGNPLAPAVQDPPFAPVDDPGPPSGSSITSSITPFFPQPAGDGNGDNGNLYPGATPSGRSETENLDPWRENDVPNDAPNDAPNVWVIPKRSDEREE